MNKKQKLTDDFLVKEYKSGETKLPKEKQDVIKLFYVETYLLKEISAILNIAEGTVKSRLFKVREKLKTILKNNNLIN